MLKFVQTASQVALCGKCVPHIKDNGASQQGMRSGGRPPSQRTNVEGVRGALGNIDLDKPIFHSERKSLSILRKLGSSPNLHANKYVCICAFFWRRLSNDFSFSKESVISKG